MTQKESNAFQLSMKTSYFKGQSCQQGLSTVLIHISSRSENPYGVGFKPRTFGNRVVFSVPTSMNPKKETAHTGSELSDSCSVTPVPSMLHSQGKERISGFHQCSRVTATG